MMTLSMKLQSQWNWNKVSTRNRHGHSGGFVENVMWRNALDRAEKLKVETKWNNLDM